LIRVGSSDLEGQGVMVIFWHVSITMLKRFDLEWPNLAG